MPCAADDVVGCTNACNDGFVEDCVTLGAMYLSGGPVTVDRERAVELFQRACARDSAHGCVLLGDAYHAGIVPAGNGASARDPHAEEVLMYRRACDGGANRGCLLAGRALVSGHGGTRDPAHAAQLFGPICDRGNAEACLELGKLTQHGDGRKSDPERALGLFRKACGLGLQEGCLRVSPKGEDRSPRAP
jgi:TPR repeat protein